MGFAVHQPNSHTIDAAVAAAGSKATYAGAGASISSWLFSSEAGVLAGIVLGVLGLIVNTIFKVREDRRKQAEHEARMTELISITQGIQL